MKKAINICLWVTIFLLIAVICVISIKKFFDIKQVKRLDNILATNYISGFVSFNKMVDKMDEQEKEEIDIIEIEDVNKEDVILEEEQEELKESDESADEPSIPEQNNLLEVKKEETDEELDSVLFDGLTEQALVNKLEKNLKNELSGTSINFINFYKDYGLDPYLSAAIVLHETGCSWTCSSLVKECFNYGGMKGGENKYKDTNYTCYNSKEEGINAYLNMLYNNYYSKGLNTPELINPKYASSLEWSVAINKYINKIKNS